MKAVTLELCVLFWASQRTALLFSVLAHFTQAVCGVSVSLAFVIVVFVCLVACFLASLYHEPQSRCIRILESNPSLLLDGCSQCRVHHRGIGHHTWMVSRRLNSQIKTVADHGSFISATFYHHQPWPECTLRLNGTALDRHIDIGVGTPRCGCSRQHAKQQQGLKIARQ